MKTRKKPSEHVFDAILILYMTLIVIITLYPFWYVLVISFNEGMDANRGGIYFWPRVFSTTNYEAVFRNSSLLRGFFLSVARTVVGTLSAVFFTSMVAYALSHQQLVARKAYMLYGTITMFFGAGLIPYYLLIRDLGLRNTFWVYIIPVLFNFYNMIVIMAFFRQLPGDLEESAKIDGAGYWRIFLRIVLPLSTPILATMCLFNGVYHWNEYFTAVLYIDKPELLPIQTILFKIVAESSAIKMLYVPDVIARRKLTPESVKMATMMVATFPIICVYPFLQKYFAKGILVGSLKG